MNQLEIVSLEMLVPKKHNYRRFKALWNFKNIEEKLSKLQCSPTYKGYGMMRLFLCLVVQFMEDISDRELEAYLEENMAVKWFCGFQLQERTPDYTLFTKLRSRIGTKLLSTIFQELKQQLKTQGYMDEAFTFVDASHLISKASLWQERDKAIEKKYEKLNNETLPQVAHDKQARIGCKGKGKFWYGYKEHVSVDMDSGMINKVAITPANLTDAAGFKHVSTKKGVIYADKGYCLAPATRIAKQKGVELRAIKKNNMEGKDAALDKGYSKLRAPYERVFSRMRKRVRYVGIVKNQFAGFMYAICFNMKRLLRLSPPPKLA